jgi:hypothetical protein
LFNFFCKQEVFLIEAFYVPRESDSNEKVDYEYKMTKAKLERMVDGTATAMVQQAKHSLDNVCCIVYTNIPGFF